MIVHRDVEALLAERGIVVSYETIRTRVAKPGARYADELRTREARPGRTWHLDEMAVRVGGALPWLWRAVDEHGQTLDVLLQERRDTAAATRFFRRLLAIPGAAPDRVTTDGLGSYAIAITQVPETRSAEPVQVRSNHRVEQAHQPTRVRACVMRRFESAASAQRLLDAFSRVCALFRPGRHRGASASPPGVTRPASRGGAPSPAGHDDYAAVGKRSTNEAPRPAGRSTAIVPPCASITRWQMLSPSPYPPVAFDRDRSTR